MWWQRRKFEEKKTKSWIVKIATSYEMSKFCILETILATYRTRNWKKELEILATHL